MNRFTQWVIHHDENKWFIILYIGLSLVLSIAISLFWLLFAVMVHFAFELIRQHYKQPDAGRVVMESLWETKLDLALVVFAWWLAVYLDFIFGVVGIGAAARAGAQTASRAGRVGGQALAATSRAAAWSRIIRGILLSVDDVGNAAKAIYQSRKARELDETSPVGEQTPAPHNAEATSPGTTTDASSDTDNTVPPSSWSGRWVPVDYIGVILFGVSFVLIVLAPQLIGMSWEEILRVTAEEFRPW